MKYMIKTNVSAVKLIDKCTVSIARIAEMLPDVPHFYTDDGLVFPNPNGENEAIPYNHYIIKEAHGLSAMSAELFESVTQPMEPINYDSMNGDDLTIGRLRNYLNQLPEGVMGKEVWIGTTEGRSNQCRAIHPLNKRDDADYDIIMEPTIV